MKTVFVCLFISLFLSASDATFGGKRGGGLFGGLGGLGGFGGGNVETEIIQPVIIPQPVAHVAPPLVHAAPAHFVHPAPIVHAAPVAHVEHAPMAVAQPVQTVETAAPISAGDGNAEGIRLGMEMLKWISRNRPEMLGTLTGIAIRNPNLLQGFLG